MIGTHGQKNKINAWAATLLKKVNGLLAPNRNECIYCKQKANLSSSHLGLCTACYSSIPWITEVYCTTCGRYEDCYDCRRREATFFTHNRSAVQYDERMKDLLARYKYRGDERLLPLMAAMLNHAYRLSQAGQHLGQGGCQRYLTYVPLSSERLLERGFNQAEQMARQLGAQLNIPVVPLLHRVRHTDKQSFKSRASRLDDLQHVFNADITPLQGLNEIKAGSPLDIYIVDDVYTTGSTLNQCAKVLLEQVDARIYGLTWAR